MRTQVERIEALSKGGPSAGGDKWRASLFGPAYSSDNAGDGPRVRNNVSPTLSERDKRSMISHIKGARIHNSDATQCEWVITNQHQFARKLAEYRAYKAARLTTRRCSLEQYILQFPFNDVHCLGEAGEHGVDLGNEFDLGRQLAPSEGP